jgi:tartrate dehydratase beta subunit/fumarate hydratase class I family protein
VLICFQELLVEEVLPLLVEKFPLAVSVKGIGCSLITQMFNQKVLEWVQ